MMMQREKDELFLCGERDIFSPFLGKNKLWIKFQKIRHLGILTRT
jgi:hypothetical protein